MTRQKLRFAMVGTRGVPARYGGFETAVEEIGRRLVQRGYDVDVYCRNEGQKLDHYLGMRLINLPAIRRRSLETLSHSGLSIAHSVVSRPDAMVLFNAANAPFLPFLRAAHLPAVMHMDGLEWKRTKWAGAGARYYRRAEAMAARSSAPLIADARGIAEYLQSTFGRDSHFIPYGAPILDPPANRLVELNLKPRAYHLIVARMEPENHVAMAMEGYARSGSPHPLVVVGSAPYASTYTAQVTELARHPGIRLLGSVWDGELLDQLYAHCHSYLHGHSVGGTNPSLLRALGCGAPVTAYDVIFNREVTGGHARFFTDVSSAALAIAADAADPAGAVTRGQRGRAHAEERYRWEDVTDEYEALLVSLAQGRA